MSNTIELTTETFWVDLEMCGDPLPAGFDVAAFCRVLDQYLPVGLDARPVLGSFNGARNTIDIDEDVWNAALDEYCRPLDEHSFYRDPY